MKFHLTANGEAKPCRAVMGRCPFGSAEDHFGTAGEARAAFESRMNAIPDAFEKSPMVLTTEGQVIFDRLDKAGIKALLVGGCVRDHLLGRDSKDVDMELYGSRRNGQSLELSDVSQALRGVGGLHVDEAGASFSVLKVRLNDEEFDLALPRTEKSTGDGHTDYNLDHDSRMPFDEAASRRDFTINAMAFDPKTGELLDPYGGLKDLQLGRLRHVSDAFSDDPLRCLRAVNFASRFGFDVDPETVEYCKTLSSSFKVLSSERVEEEFAKVFDKGTDVQKGLEVLHDIGWSKEMPAFTGMSRSELSGFGKRLDETPIEHRRAVLARSMMQSGYKNPMKSLTGVIKTRKRVTQTVELMEASNNDSWGEVVRTHREFKKSNPDVTNSSLRKSLSVTGDNHRVLDSLPETPVESTVTGKKLIDQGFKQGPEMGKIIQKAQKIQDEESLYDFDKLLERSIKS